MVALSVSLFPSFNVASLGGNADDVCSFQLPFDLQVSCEFCGQKNMVFLVFFKTRQVSDSQFRVSVLDFFSSCLEFFGGLGELPPDFLLNLLRVQYRPVSEAPINLAAGGGRKKMNKRYGVGFLKHHDLQRNGLKVIYGKCMYICCTLLASR